jgi:hypothetical protein
MFCWEIETKAHVEGTWHELDPLPRSPPRRHMRDDELYFAETASLGMCQMLVGETSTPNDHMAMPSSNEVAAMYADEYVA